MDAIERAYGRPLLGEDPEPQPAALAAPPGGPLMGVAPAAPISLRGCILTPDEVIDDGWVDVEAGLIRRIGSSPPAAAYRRLETDGVILPGLIDLHGHPEYNVFAAWEPPKVYANRGRWRDSPEYAKVVKEPLALLKQAPSLTRTLSRYAEARALVTGTTAIQGANGTYADVAESLVRNVDRRIFGQHRARSIVDLGRVSTEERAALKRQIDTGVVNAVYVHLAEGTDPPSRAEFADLVGSGLLTAATVIIHGTALEAADFDAVAAAGAKLVWSPQSNLRLYADTTKVGLALDRGIAVGLGADWLPTGSPSLLDEIRVAARALAEQGHPVDARQLVRMITSGAAGIAGLADHLGLLAVGRPADVLVLERRHPDPWESVVLAARWAVQLVLLGGDVAYGRRDWVRTLAGVAVDGPDPGAAESAVAWGRPMLVDTSYSVQAPAEAPPRLGDLRAKLVDRYPQVGPILA